MKVDSKHDPFRILLTNTNRWPAPARLAIVLAKAGCSVSAICPKVGHPLLKTGVIQRSFIYSVSDPLGSLLHAVDAVKPEMIIPCDDRGVKHLHELHKKARSLARQDIVLLIERSLGRPENYAAVSGRFELLAIAAEEGIAVPHTKVIRTVEEVGAWPGFGGSVTTMPMVLKVDGTWGGSGVRVAETAEEAARFFRDLTRKPGVGEILKRFLFNRDQSWLQPWADRSFTPFVIGQSLIDGRPANCAVFCWEGEVLAGTAVEVISAQSRKGPATVVRVVEGQEMLQAATRIASRLGLSGFFGLDFMIENGTGKCFLIEMNPRVTPLCHLQLGKGRDMVSALWSKLSGGSYTAATPITRKDLIAYFPQGCSLDREFARDSFHDTPVNHPDLAKELLRPWSNRSVLGRFIDYLRRNASEQELEACTFNAALLSPREMEYQNNSFSNG